MDKKVIKVYDTEIIEYDIHQQKISISINYIYIYINATVASNKFPFGKQDFRYFIGYEDNKEIRPLCIFFPEMSIYKSYSDKTKYMNKDEKN